MIMTDALISNSTLFFPVGLWLVGPHSLVVYL